MAYPTLLLNIGYEPLRLISWQEAVTGWFLGKLEVVESYEDRPCRSQHLDIKIPAVVRIKNRYHPYMADVSFDRWHLYARDGWKCQYCGEKFREADLTYDHVIPKSRGGPRSWTNIVTACGACNNRKGDRTPAEAEMPLLRKPFRPSWMPNLLVEAIRKGRAVPEQWVGYIDWLRGISPNAQPSL